MRSVMDELERSGLSWYVTGSEALAAYGSPRQTMDIDVVVEASVDQLDALAHSTSDATYYSEPMRFANRLMAALIDRHGAGKVDLIVRDRDAWGLAAMQRRLRWHHPTLGSVWISSLEDLVLAKLEWSEGSSELQQRDAAALLRVSRDDVDRGYLESWASELGVVALLQRAWRAADAP